MTDTTRIRKELEYDEPIVRRLVEQGYDVTCLVRCRVNAADLRELGATLVQGDITDPASMRQSMAGADVVFHMAAWHSVILLRGRHDQS